MLNAHKRKIPRKKGVEWIALVLGVFAVLVVLVLLHEMQKFLPDLPQDTPALPGGGRVGVVDSVYYHYPFHFACPLPGPDWRFEHTADDTLLIPTDAQRPLLSQVTWLIDLQRLDTATARVGVLQLDEKQDAKDVAVSILDEMIREAEKDGQRVRLLQPFTGPAHKILQGWYFALVLPQDESPVWVVSVLPRGERLFVLWCRTAETHYAEMRQEFENLTSGFRPLLLSAKPAKK